MPKRPAIFLALVASLFTSCGDGSGKPGAFDKAGYHVRDKVVWYLPTWTSQPFTVEGADVSTFTFPLPKDGDAIYARDKASIYLRGRALKGVDVATFELIDQDYSRDARNVYRGDMLICDDPKNFQALSANFVKNGHAVYRLYPKVEVVTEDVAGFRELSSSDGYSYFGDKENVYVNGNPLPGANPATFRVLKGGHSRDDRQLYYFNEPMPAGALMDSFEVLEGTYSRDASRVYHAAKVVPEADPRTFEVTDAKFQRGKDAHRQYEQASPAPVDASNSAPAPKKEP